MALDWSPLYKKYKGLWVALASDEKTVVGFGDTVKKALFEAKKKSNKIPILTKIPKEINSYVGII